MKLCEPVFAGFELRRRRCEMRERHRAIFAVSDFCPLLDDIFVRIRLETKRDIKWIRRVFQFNAREGNICVYRRCRMPDVNQIRGRVAIGMSGFERGFEDETVAGRRIKFGLAREDVGSGEVAGRCAVMNLIKTPVAAGAERQNGARGGNFDCRAVRRRGLKIGGAQSPRRRQQEGQRCGRANGGNFQVRCFHPVWFNELLWQLQKVKPLRRVRVNAVGEMEIAVCVKSVRGHYRPLRDGQRQIGRG